VRVNLQLAFKIGVAAQLPLKNEGVFFFVVFGTSKDKYAFSIAILNVEHFSHTPIHLSHKVDSISSSYIRCGFEVCDYIILHNM
jgi:hypothetical protein